MCDSFVCALRSQFETNATQKMQDEIVKSKDKRRENGCPIEIEQ